MAFSSSIVLCDEKKIDNCLLDLLRFLSPPSHDSTYLKLEYWLKIWVNLMHQMGLGYTSGSERGNESYIHQTDLSLFLATSGDIKSYDYYWALRFQFPFSYPKHLHYIKNGVAVQPIVLMASYLVELYDSSRDISNCYLTKSEITQFLMKSKNHDAQNIRLNVSTILKNRSKNYDYSSESSVPGFEEAGDHFFSRGRLFLERFEPISFDTERVRILNRSNFDKVKSFLSYAEPPVIFKHNDRDTRNAFFIKAYCDLELAPDILRRRIERGTFEQSKKQHMFRKPIINPENIGGTFRQSIGTQRTFQPALRRDILRLYNSRCCVCGLDVEEFLVTSHIIPVKIDRSIASDRRNCLLLCVLHDFAFEKGYIALDDSRSVIVNPSLLPSLSHPVLKQLIKEKAGMRIRRPNQGKFTPLSEYLERHRRLHDIE